MAEFKRAEAKPVPENWRDGLRSRLNQHAIESSSFHAHLQERTGTFANLDNSDPNGWPTANEYLSYFETLITQPDICAALERQWLRGEESREHTLADEDDSALYSAFRKWWGLEYIKLNLHYHNAVVMRLDSAHDAIVSIVRGATVEEAYESIRAQMSARDHWYTESGEG